MGTVINQKIYGKDAEKSAREINDMLTDLDCNVFSSKVKSSLTYKLNGNKILETDNEDFLNLTNTVSYTHLVFLQTRFTE